MNRASTSMMLGLAGLVAVSVVAASFIFTRPRSRPTAALSAAATAAPRSVSTAGGPVPPTGAPARPQVPPAAPAPAPPQHRLGGGYRGVRWGTTVEGILAAFPGFTVVREALAVPRRGRTRAIPWVSCPNYLDQNSLCVELPTEDREWNGHESRAVRVKFEHDAVRYTLRDNAVIFGELDSIYAHEGNFDITLRALQERFGPPTSTRSVHHERYPPGVVNQTYEWADGETVIRLLHLPRVPEPIVFNDSIFQGGHMSLTYLSAAAIAAREQATRQEQQAREQQQAEALRQREQQVRNSL
jgi:hypothetical protein